MPPPLALAGLYARLHPTGDRRLESRARGCVCRVDVGRSEVSSEGLCAPPGRSYRLPDQFMQPFFLQVTGRLVDTQWSDSFFVSVPHPVVPPFVPPWMIPVGVCLTAITRALYLNGLDYTIALDDQRATRPTQPSTPEILKIVAYLGRSPP